MQVSEFMTTKLITISGNEPVSRAARLIYAHKIRRLPVVDDGVLVGIIGERAIAAELPSSSTSLSSKEMSATLSKVTVRVVMQREVVTVTPETSAENALGLAQKNRVGCLVVVDDQNSPVGIVTTNDFVYRILNPLLGLGKPGVRLHISDCGDIERITQVIELMKKYDSKLEVIHIDDSRITGKRDLIVQLETEDTDLLVDELTKKGLKVRIRKRDFWPIEDDK